jgi:16S rRNA (adenine1518-N6/adenine1519-N6)-dimethyltransferase
VLQFDPSAHFQPRRYKVVANLPYYITSPTIRHFLESPCPPSRLVIMVQREVAERMVARPGEMSLLSVGVQYFADPRIAAFVPAQSFYPPPKVDSAVVNILVPEQPKVDVPPEAFFTVAQAGFAQARKQLHNSLTARLGLPPGKATELLRRAGVEPSRRPQTLSIDEWAGLTRCFLDDSATSRRFGGG